MNKNELVKELRSTVFRTPDDLLDAWYRVQSIADTSNDKASVWMAVREFANALANEIEKLGEGEQVQYTDDPNKWYELDLAVVKAMAWGIFRSVDEATPFVDDLYDHHIEYVRGLDQDRLIELVRAIDPDLLEIVEV